MIKCWMIFVIWLSFCCTECFCEICDLNQLKTDTKIGDGLFCCPRSGEPRENIFCCGSFNSSLYCCNNTSLSVYHKDGEPSNTWGGLITIVLICSYGAVIMALCILDAVSYCLILRRRKIKKKL